MRLLKESKRHVAVGEYYVDRRAGAVVEIMAVHPSGDVMVLDITADLDAAWQRLRKSAVSSRSWERIARRPKQSDASRSDDAARSLLAGGGATGGARTNGRRSIDGC